MKHSQGFTLIELMITVAVAAILLTVAVPSYRSFVQGNRSAAQANVMLRALAYTRSEAVKRAEVITICQSSDQSSCGGSTDWQSGWIVFSDAGTVGKLDIGDTLLQVSNGLSGGSTLTAGKSAISYAASGALADPSKATTFTLKPADCKGDMQRVIGVTASGEATVQKQSCS